MYVYLTKQNAAAELIPDEDPVFPGVPVERRYAPDFVQRLVHVPDGTEVRHGWVYDPETGDWAPPPPPEAPETPDPPEVPAPGLEERVELLETETAALTAAIERGIRL